MRRILTFILFLLFFLQPYAEAETIISGSDAKIHYCGRILKENGNASFDWSGVRATVEFEGTELKLNYADSHRNWINVWIDRIPDEKSDYILPLGDTSIVLAANLKYGPHKVIIEKRTEGEQGKLTFKSFSTDCRFLQAQDPSTRLMEFIGDSYTCGYGTESLSSKERFRPETENCNLTYAAILGRIFNSEVRLISHSGRGVIRNWGGYDKDKPMCFKYAQVFDCDTSQVWRPKGEKQPQIVVVYLGTNDFSCGEHPSLEKWCEAYKKLIGQIRCNYGDTVPILCVASKADELMPEYVREAAKRCGYENVHYTAIHPAAHNDSSDLGADDHPNYKGHRKVALCIMPYISTLTGWDLPEFIH